MGQAMFRAVPDIYRSLTFTGQLMKFSCIARRTVAACLMASKGAVWAADDYSSKPIRPFGSFTAGSSLDIGAPTISLLAQHVSDKIGTGA